MLVLMTVSVYVISSVFLRLALRRVEVLGRKASGLVWWFLLYRGSWSIAASRLMSLFAVQACFVCVSFWFGF